MKLKNKLIILFFGVCFILLGIVYLKKNSDVIYNKVTSESNKKFSISYNEGFISKEGCDRYYEGVGTRFYSPSDVKEGFPLYIVNGCASSLKHYLANNDGVEDWLNDEAACLEQKKYVEDNNYPEQGLKSYKDAKCYEKTGDINFDNICNAEIRNNIINKFLDYGHLLDNYNDKCSDDITEGEINKESYDFDGVCEHKRLYNSSGDGFTGIVLSDDSRNECNYRLYYVNGVAVKYTDLSEAQKSNVLNELNELEEKLKIDNSNKSLVNDYKLICNDTGKSPEASIISTGTCSYGEGLPNSSNGIITSGNYDSANFYYGETKVCLDSSNPLQGQTVILPEGVTKNKYPQYLVNGCSWGLADIINNTQNNECITEDYKKKVCESQYEFINVDRHGRGYAIYEFNTSCIDSGILDSSKRFAVPEYINVIFSASNAFGIDCKSGNKEDHYVSDQTSSCVYHYSISSDGNSKTLSKSDLPDTSSLQTVNTGFKFKGWVKQGNDCKDAISGDLSFTLNKDAGDIVFEACYDESVAANSSFSAYTNCNGEYVGGTKATVDGTYELNKGKASDVSNTGLLKSFSRSEKYYAVTPSDIKDSEVEKGPFVINEFCKLTCIEDFNYYYPSIFQTVKSGTYFEILQYPYIESNYTCYESYNYDAWESAYYTAINKEKKAWVDYMNDKNIDDIIISSSIEDMNCPCKANDAKGVCVQHYNRNYYNLTIYKYQGDSDYGEVTSEDASGSFCSNMTLREKQTELKRIYEINTVSNFQHNYEVANSNRKEIEKSNGVCVNALNNTKVSKDDFYKLTASDIKFTYQNSDFESKEEILELSNQYRKDSGLVYFDDLGNQNELNIGDMTKEKYNTSYGEIEIDFDAINPELPTISRRTVVKYNFTPKDHLAYYSKSHTGEITDTPSEDDNAIYLGYVYPVALTASGKRDVSFDINIKTNLDHGATEVFSADPSGKFEESLKKAKDEGKISEEAITNYKCSFNIANDIVIKDNKNGDFNENFYVRYVDTNNVDPNDRKGSGLLGANWANYKGEALIKAIQEKSKNKNTYNPNNLEYSFTLGTKALNAIREYNKTTTYSDFKLECNDMGGECKSKFLNGLATGNIGTGMDVGNVKTVMNRNSWKYYVGGKCLVGGYQGAMYVCTDYESGEWVVTDSILSDDISFCTSETTAKNKYDCIYRKVNKGVLP